MSGSVRPSDVVESLLLGAVADPRRREVLFTFQTPAGEREFGLRATGVDHLLMNAFMHQNIVHEVRVLGRESGSHRRAESAAWGPRL
jgi:hypothetical protein